MSASEEPPLPHCL